MHLNNILIFVRIKYTAVRGVLNAILLNPWDTSLGETSSISKLQFTGITRVYAKIWFTIKYRSGYVKIESLVNIDNHSTCKITKTN